MTVLWDKLKTARKPVLLYGMGNAADRILDICASFGIKVSGVFASDGFVRDKEFRGFKIMSYSAAKAVFGSFTVLVCFGTSRDDVIANIERIAAEQELYAPHIPVYGEGIYDSAFLTAHEGDFERVRAALADGQSRRVFDGVINYKISGELKYLYECESRYEDDFSLVKRGGVYVDLGAYNGDTVRQYIELCGEYEKIYAVEPDSRNFRKLSRCEQELKNVTAVNAAAAEFSGTQAFSMRGGRNASAGGTDEVRCVSVDDLLEGGRADFIKMDVEGAECAAIKGARQTVLKYKPCLQVACYHRNEDEWKLIDAVMDIRGDYKVYMRHNRYVPAWDTNLFFV